MNHGEDVDPQAVIERWVRALNDPQDATLIAAAASEEIEVLRHGTGARRGQVVERFDTTESLLEWVRRSPQGLVFAVSGPVHGPAEHHEARYRVTVEDFEGGGVWRFRADGAGRLTWLEHIPDELADRHLRSDPVS